MKSLRKKQSNNQVLIRDILPPNQIEVFPIFKKSLLKIIVFTIIISLNWAGLSAILRTFAYLSDTENSQDNLYSATTLDFSISSVADFSPEIIPTQNSIRTINIQNNGILDFVYDVKVENPTGTLCNYLELQDDLTNTFNPLVGFVSATTTFPDKTNWLFSARLIDDDESLQSQVCSFDFVFTGWHSNFSSSTQGFSDEERIENEIRSGRWIIHPGDLVINELMWMGSYLRPFDEWIELRNMTDYPIDLSGWQLTKLIGFGWWKRERLMLEIPAGKTIPANNFFLISNSPKEPSAINVEPDLIDTAVSLRNWSLQVKLYKGDWQDPSNLIDIADDGQGRPLAGYHGLIFHFSIERNDIPGDGTLEENWHTCFDDSPEMRAYWDSMFILGRSINRGTPGGRNLSDYDESALIEYYQELEIEILREGVVVPDFIDEKENYDEEELPIIEELGFAEVAAGDPVSGGVSGGAKTEDTLADGGVTPTNEEITTTTEEAIVTETTSTEETIIIEATTTDENITEEETEEIIEEATSTDEAKPIGEETPIGGEEPVIEEEPATLPDDISLDDVDLDIGGKESEG